MKYVALLFLLAAQMYGLEEHKRSKLWKVSAVLLVAASAVDAGTSWNRVEANPVLANQHGRFAMKGVVIKAGIVSATLGVQWLLASKHRKVEKYVAVTNLAMADVMVGVAVWNRRNWRVQ